MRSPLNISFLSLDRYITVPGAEPQWNGPRTHKILGDRKETATSYRSPTLLSM